MKGFITRKRYRRNKVTRKHDSALKIQSRFKAFKERKKYLKVRKAIMKCQGNVLSRQFRRAFLKMREDVTIAQMFIKRYMAMQWFR